MEKITQIFPYEKEKWNSCVKSFDDYDVFYLCEYVTAFMNEKPKNGIPILILYESGRDRAINVVFRRDIALDEKFFGKINEGVLF